MSRITSTPASGCRSYVFPKSNSEKLLGYYYIAVGTYARYSIERQLSDPLFQERTYNPYYTLVCHHLCQTAHAYKITLQYCLWDFLRDLGESHVGGAEVVKNVKDEDDQFGAKTISKVRLRNVARAFGWWIAKNSVTLTILKVCSSVITIRITDEALIHNSLLILRL